MNIQLGGYNTISLKYLLHPKFQEMIDGREIFFK